MILKPVYLSLFLILSTGLLFAQEKLQEALATYNAHSRDSIGLNALRDVGGAYLESDLDSARYYAEIGMALAERLNDEQQLASQYNIMGNYHQRIGEADSAMIYYEKVLEISRRLEVTKGLAIALNNIAILHTYSGDYPKALELYLEALEAEEKIGDLTGIAEAYNNIGVIHYYMGDIPSTLEYFETSIDYSEQAEDSAILKKGYNNMGALYSYQKEYDKALAYYEKSLVLAQNLGQKKEIGIALNNIATFYSEVGDLQTSMDYYRRSLELREEMQDHQGMTNTYINMATDAYQLGAIEACQAYFDEALKLTKEYDLKFLRAETYERISAVREDQGKLQEALDYSRRRIALKDSLLNEERVTAVAEMETRYETEKKERELLEEQVKNAQLEEDKARKNSQLIGLGLGALGLLFAALFIIQRNKRRAEQDKSRAVLAERDRGLQAVVEAQEEERSRISKDLHDGVGQQLSGLKMGIGALQQELSSSEDATKEKVSRLAAVIDDTAKDVRSISHEMMPRALKELGLAAALNDMLAKSLGNGPIKYSFEELRAVGRLRPSMELALYRIAQEVVNNIIKHSGAYQVEVQLYAQKDSVVMNISDDGRGFDIDAGADGHGMLNMQQRARLEEGQLDVESDEASGTTVRIRVPLRRA